MTDIIAKILSNYDSETPGTREKLYRILMHGRLAGTGRMVILPVDQGFEHGPARSFAMNPDAYDPLYHYQMAIDSGVNAYAAPLGSLELGAHKFAGQVPLILKINSGSSLFANAYDPDQAVTGSVDDALRLGCAGIGFTFYAGSDNMYDQEEELRELTAEAKAKGLAVVAWCYPRGGSLSSEGETALDVVAYSAHMACLLGAHIIKVKLPSAHLELEEAKAAIEKAKIPTATLTDRVREVVRSCFNGRRMVIFSGGSTKDDASVLEEIRAIAAGGGNGSIMGRNVFQRPHSAGMALLNQVMDIYRTA